MTAQSDTHRGATHWAVVRITVLVAFLAWRAANSLWVLAVDRSRTADLSVSEPSRGERVRKGLSIPSPTGRPLDLAFQHLQLLREHVPQDAKVYYVEDFAGARDLARIQRFFRIRWLVYPMYTQPIERPVLPASAAQPPLDRRPAWLLDVRQVQPDRPGADFEQVATGSGATLWRRRRGN